MSALPLSVVILTLDEQDVIGRCVRSVAWAQEVLVVDSGSTDRTREIAVGLGARVIEQPWLGFAAQRAAAEAVATHDWVLFLDADEVLTPELTASIKAVLTSSPDERDGYATDRRTEWLGRLMPNEQRRSKVESFVRLYHRRTSHWDQDMVVHERVIVPGRHHLLDGILIHWRAESLTDHVLRGASYSALEAELAEAHDGRRSSVRRAVVMPLLRAGWVLVARHNLLLGTRGVLHGLYRANGEWMRQLELLGRQDTDLLPAGGILTLITPQVALPASARSRATLQIWLAPARLLVLALGHLRASATDTEGLLGAYLAWNEHWVRAGKAWEAARLPFPVDPPGYEQGLV